jgi:hypothetical protein
MTEMTPEHMATHRLMTIFGEPKTPDPALFLAEFVKAIKGYSPAVLDEAVNRIIKANVFWPKPAEVREIAESILDRTGTSHAEYLRQLDEREAKWKKPSDDERARTKALFDNLKLTLSGVDGKPVDFNELAIRSQRPGFEAMQRNSKNPHLHTLTPTSKRMTGESE